MSAFFTGVQLFYSKRSLVTHKGVSEEDGPDEVPGELHSEASGTAPLTLSDSGPPTTGKLAPIYQHRRWLGVSPARGIPLRDCD